ncbi:MAG: Hsp70 family protein, partial [Actinomycetota bacterium]|nr:Hsp70 family protein [Actinomycetota bacterium]
MSYQVGIDLGTTFSAAAVCRSGDGRVEVVPLGGRAASVASVVFVGSDGSLVVGEAAERRALTDPDRVVREFKRRIGDETPLVVGGEPVAAEVVAARFVEWVLARVAEREGGAPSGVALTHPAGWGPHKRELFAGALRARGLDEVVFLSEPQAAAVGYASAERVAPGAVVGVYDLGGGTFDAAVVRKSAAGVFEVVGRPEGIERLGGVDFDEVIFEHVRGVLGSAWEGLDPEDPAVWAAVAGLRRECTAAKEALSADTEVVIPVMLPGVHTQVRLVRAEFEEMIRPAVEETVAALGRAVGSAGVEASELDAVLLVGGSSRIPLITQLVSAELGRPVAVDADPKTTTATGAALTITPPTMTTPVTQAAELLENEAPPIVERPPTDFAEPDIPRPRTEAERHRRTRTLLLAAAVSAVAMVGLAGAVDEVAGVGPVGNLSAPAVAAADDGSGSTGETSSGDAMTAADPWTGGPRTQTTAPGPTRPAAQAAPAQPGARLRNNGATGSSPSTPAPTASAQQPASTSPTQRSGTAPMTTSQTPGTTTPQPQPLEEPAPPVEEEPAPPAEEPAPPVEEEP